MFNSSHFGFNQERQKSLMSKKETIGIGACVEEDKVRSARSRCLLDGSAWESCLQKYTILLSVSRRCGRQRSCTQSDRLVRNDRSAFTTQTQIPHQPRFHWYQESQYLLTLAVTVVAPCRASKVSRLLFRHLPASTCPST